MSDLKSFVVSLALWPDKPPLHNITSIIYIASTSRLVTASDCGHILVWKYSANKTFVPCHYLIGHRSRITKLLYVGDDRMVDMEYVISFSDENEIGLWEVREGRNVEFINNTPWNIINATCQEVTHSKIKLLFCCLRSPEVLVLHSISLAPVCVLTCRGSQNWFSSVTSLYTVSNKENVVMGTTVSGMVSTWMVDFSILVSSAVQNTSVPKIEADAHKDVQLADAQIISHCPENASVVMLLSPSRLKVFHTKNWDLLCYQDSHREDYFKDGHFVDPSQILIHTDTGRSVLYKLPHRADCNHQEFLSASKIMYDNIPSIVSEIQVDRSLSHLRHSIFSKNSNRLSTVFKAFLDGSIVKWEINSDNGNCSSSQFYNLKEAWSYSQERSQDLSQFLKAEPSLANCSLKVTSITVMSELSMVAMGMEDGNIFVTTIDNMIRHVFLEDPATSNGSILRLSGHTGPVLSLLHPTSALRLPQRLTSVMDGSKLTTRACLQLLRLAHLLWSGGSDCSLRLWCLRTSSCLLSLHCHSSPVVALKLSFNSGSSSTGATATATGASLTGSLSGGFSQGLTTALLNCVPDRQEHTDQIRALISMCMSAFVIGVSESDGVSVISLMKRKLILHSASCPFSSPIRNLGWQLDSGFLLVETVDSTVYVWDLSTSSMDRVEHGPAAVAIMAACPFLTRIRSRYSRLTVSGSNCVRRYSLHSAHLDPTAAATAGLVSTFGKMIRTQFILTDCIVTEENNAVPLICFDVVRIVESLALKADNLAPFYQSLCDLDKDLLNDPISLDDLKSADNDFCQSQFDTLLSEVTTNQHQSDLRMLLSKILLALSFSANKSSSSSTSPGGTAISAFCNHFMDLRLVPLGRTSFGTTNSKTGCISFNLHHLFSPSVSSLTGPHLSPTTKALLQLTVVNSLMETRGLSISNVSSSHDRFFLSDSAGEHDHGQSASSDRKWHRILREYRHTILHTAGPTLLRQSTDASLIFCLESVFSELIAALLDNNEALSKSGSQLVARTVSYMSGQQLQTYMLVWRMFIYPSLEYHQQKQRDKYQLPLSTPSAGLALLLDQLSQVNVISSSFASDWMWWWSSSNIGDNMNSNNNGIINSITNAGRNSITDYTKDDSIFLLGDGTPQSALLALSRLQMAALLNLAVVGAHLGCSIGSSHHKRTSKDDDNEAEISRLFSKVFSLDNFFLARVTCDFLCGLLAMSQQQHQISCSGLLALAMYCLSCGFCVWEPYLDSNGLISRLLVFAAGDHACHMQRAALKALYTIGSVRPLVLVMAAYREMLRIQTQHPNSSGHHSNQKIPSAGIVPTTAIGHSVAGLRRNSTTPTLDVLGSHSKVTVDQTGVKLRPVIQVITRIMENNPDPGLLLPVLSEVVEMYVYVSTKIMQRYDIASDLHIFSRFPSVSINSVNGHISVGSSNGSLSLIDVRTGKYFSTVAHKKAIKITKFSDDSKFLASYSPGENLIKIWHITAAGMFNFGHHVSFQVNMLASHVVPNLSQMRAALMLSDSIGGDQDQNPAGENEDVQLSWQTDKILLVKQSNLILRKIKI